jgi:hypothetical protein
VVVAQNQTLGLVRDLQDEVKAMTAEFMTLRSEYQRNNTLLQLILAKLATLVPQPSPATYPQASQEGMMAEMKAQIGGLSSRMDANQAESKAERRADK